MKRVLICVGVLGTVVFLAAQARSSSPPATASRPAATPSAASVAPLSIEPKAPVAPAAEDFNARGCTHDHEGEGEIAPTPVAGPPEDPFEFPARTIQRIETELAVSRDCAVQVGRVLSDHMARTADVERQLGDAADASVAETLWAQAEESLGKLLTAAQIEKLKLMPLEAPPSAQREHSMGGR